VIAVLTLPFAFEGKRRAAQALESLAALNELADVVVCFENDRMADGVSPSAGIQQAFAAADQTISQSIQAISALFNRRGLIHLGFDDFKAALRGVNARCLFGYGEAEGDNRPFDALARALRNPLMEKGRLLRECETVLVQVSGGAELTLNEVQLLMDELNRHIGDRARLLFGAAVDPRLAGRIAVTILSSLQAEEGGKQAPFRVETPDAAAVDAAVDENPVQEQEEAVREEQEPQEEVVEVAEVVGAIETVEAIEFTGVEPSPVLASAAIPAFEEPEPPNEILPEEEEVAPAFEREPGESGARSFEEDFSGMAEEYRESEEALEVLDEAGVEAEEEPHREDETAAAQASLFGDFGAESNPPEAKAEPESRPEEESAIPAAPAVRVNRNERVIRPVPGRTLRSSAFLNPNPKPRPKAVSDEKAEPVEKLPPAERVEPHKAESAPEIRPQPPIAPSPVPAVSKAPMQETLKFEPVTRGRFEKSEPTIVDGQDLDVPTFMRRNIRIRP
jgi:cell division protein FtsZ